MAGNLYIVATPIGNLEDITFRAVNILKSVDLIACEDTRHSRVLLSKYEISKPLTSYHSYNKTEKLSYLIKELNNGKNIAVISEAGTPGISDPGFLLVKKAIEEDIQVVPVPGPSAVISALCCSGLPTDDFIFLGFLPRKKGKIKRVIENAASHGKTVVFYESPYRLKKTIEIVKDLFDKNSEIVIARELTKRFEEFIRGNLNNISDMLPEKILGEITILINPVIHSRIDGETDNSKGNV
ncbi:MAG: Ribosomal RNA small subunit methyltransferase I [Elusimicrobia bacterium ADurb.Bin231]|nr:MAG: Ribosomal RNA small subunit methyltransferase I [Elusimicrobia bacterium ADurb.Bin231]